MLMCVVVLVVVVFNRFLSPVGIDQKSLDLTLLILFIDFLQQQ